MHQDNHTQLNFISLPRHRSLGTHKCANITERNHHDTWTCPIHSHSQSNTNINQPTLNQQPSTLTSSNINQQFTAGQPTTSTQVTYHSKVKELENKRCKTSTKSKSDSTHTKQIWTCLICTKTITHNQTISLPRHKSLGTQKMRQHNRKKPS